jgi:ribosome-associated heat shock protein Hsp15
VAEVRVDKWLWAVRVFKTRALATDACRAGHVKVNQAPAKPAHALRIGDRVAVNVRGWERDFEVVGLLEKRVGAPAAAECLVDYSPPPPEHERVPRPLFVRDPSAGRPTKRDRRELDRLRRGK